MLNDEACTAIFVLWEADGDSIEATCELTGEHSQHEADVEGSAQFTDDDISIPVRARLCWPSRAKVAQ